MIHIAIDPGLTGAIAAIDDQAQLVLCEDLPVIRHGKLAWIEANELTTLLMTARNGRSARIIVERAQAMHPRWELLANLHRPCDPSALASEIRRLHETGLTPRDISVALRLDMGAVLQALRQDVAA